MTDPVKIAAGIDIVMGLIISGVEVYNALQDDSLTDADFLELINKQNEAQETARQKLTDLYSE